MHNALMLEKIRNFLFILEVQTKMKPFKCIKQLVLHSGIYVLLFFFTFLSLTACLIHEYVMLENMFGDFESQNQTDRAIKL